MTVPVYLELFSGSGHLSAALARAGCYVLLWDIQLGEAYDVRVRKNRSMLLGWVSVGWILGLHAGLPCTTLSRARDRPGGPPPLRSDAQPWGLDGLRPHDMQKVQDSNLMTRFITHLLRECKFYGVAWTLENPATSRLWILQPIKSLLRMRGVQTVQCDFCMFSGCFRKRTTFAFWKIDLAVLATFVCRGAPRGICARTKLPHQQLAGLASNGQFWTKVAEPYPRKMCNLIARCYCDVSCATTAANFDRFLRR